jgi:hypothetical protein
MFVEKMAVKKYVEMMAVKKYVERWQACCFNTNHCLLAVLFKEKLVAPVCEIYKYGNKKFHNSVKERLNGTIERKF